MFERLIRIFYVFFRLHTSLSSQDNVPEFVVAAFERWKNACPGEVNVDYVEMLTAVLARRAHVQEDICWSVFRTFDHADDGTISLTDVSTVLQAAAVRTIHSADVPSTLPFENDMVSFKEILTYVKDGGVGLD